MICSGHSFTNSWFLQFILKKICNAIYTAAFCIGILIRFLNNSDAIEKKVEEILSDIFKNSYRKCRWLRTEICEFVELVHEKLIIENIYNIRSFWNYLSTYILDTIQDFLCKLGMNPHMHLVEISIFSLYHVIARPTKVIKDLRKASL